MKFNMIKQSAAVLLAIGLATATCWAERIKTDGTNKQSPIKVQQLDFQDSGYGQPGPSSEIRISTVIKNASAEDDLKNVVLKLQLKNLAGDVVQEWTKNIPLLKKGATVQFDPGAVYYNYTFNNLQSGVAVEHDKPEPKVEKKSGEEAEK